VRRCLATGRKGVAPSPASSVDAALVKLAEPRKCCHVDRHGSSGRQSQSPSASHVVHVGHAFNKPTFHPQLLFRWGAVGPRLVYLRRSVNIPVIATKSRVLTPYQAPRSSNLSTSVAAGELSALAAGHRAVPSEHRIAKFFSLRPVAAVGHPLIRRPAWRERVNAAPNILSLLRSSQPEYRADRPARGRVESHQGVARNAAGASVATCLRLTRRRRKMPREVKRRASACCHSPSNSCGPSTRRRCTRERGSGSVTRSAIVTKSRPPPRPCRRRLTGCRHRRRTPHSPLGRPPKPATANYFGKHSSKRAARSATRGRLAG
jgi:hypothetical protein